MNTTPRYEKEDILINFRDMLVHLLRRWRSIVLVTVVATLLAGGARYALDLRSYNAALAADNTTTVTLEGDALANANQALKYQELYALQATYNRTAPLMQINPAAVPTRTLSYLVTAPRGFVTASLYQTHLGSLAPYEELADSADPQLDAAQIMELVTVTVQHDSGADAVADHAMLNIKIIAPTETLRDNIAAVLQQRMPSLSSAVTATMGTHGLTLAADTAQTLADSGLKTTQQNNLNNANTLRNNLKSTNDALSDEEKGYIQQMTAASDGNTTPTPPSVNKKWLLLGFAAGFVLMVGIYALGYVFGQKLHSREDFTERYGLFVFGHLAADKKQSLTERTLRRLFFKKDCPSEAATALAGRQLALAAGDAANIAIIGSADADEALFAPLKNALTKNNLTLQVLACPVRDAAALEALAAADAVVLAETVGASTYGDIYRELDLCNRFARPVLGAFIIG